MQSNVISIINDYIFLRARELEFLFLIARLRLDND